MAISFVDLCCLTARKSIGKETIFSKVGKAQRERAYAYPTGSASAAQIAQREKYDYALKLIAANSSSYKVTDAWQLESSLRSRRQQPANRVIRTVIRGLNEFGDFWLSGGWVVTVGNYFVAYFYKIPEHGTATMGTVMLRTGPTPTNTDIHIVSLTPSDSGTYWTVRFNLDYNTDISRGQYAQMFYAPDGDLTETRFPVSGIFLL